MSLHNVQPQTQYRQPQPYNRTFAANLKFNQYVFLSFKLFSIIVFNSFMIVFFPIENDHCYNYNEQLQSPNMNELKCHQNTCVLTISIVAKAFWKSKTTITIKN